MSAGKSGLAFLSDETMGEILDKDYFTSFKQSEDVETPIIFRLFKYLDKNTIEHPIINLLKRDKQTLQKDIELLKKRLETLNIKGRIEEKEVFVCGKLRNTAQFLIDSGISGDELNQMGIITRRNRPVIDILTLKEDDIDRLIENIRR
jgi:hypothetical protein